MATATMWLWIRERAGAGHTARTRVVVVWQKPVGQARQLISVSIDVRGDCERAGPWAREASWMTPMRI